MVYLVMDTLVVPPMTFYAVATTKSDKLQNCYYGRNNTDIRSWIMINIYVSVVYGLIFTAFLCFAWCCVFANGFGDESSSGQAEVVDLDESNRDSTYWNARRQQVVDKRIESKVQRTMNFFRLRKKKFSEIAEKGDDAYCPICIE